MERYIEDVIKRGELYLEITRVQQLLARLHASPIGNKEAQRMNVAHADKLFKALLAAKEARQSTLPKE